MKGKILFVLFCLNMFFVIQGDAQDTDIDWSKRLFVYYSKDPAKGYLYLQNVLKTHKGRYTDSEMKILSFAFAYNKELGIPNSPNIVNSIMHELLYHLNLYGSEDISRMDDLDRKWRIEGYIETLEAALCLFPCIGKDKEEACWRELVQQSTYFFDKVYPYRKVFDPTKPKEAEVLASIYRIASILTEVFAYTDFNLLQLSLLRFYPDVLEMQIPGNIFNAHFISSIFNNLKNQILLLGYTDSGKNYLKERANFLLQYNDLKLYILGNERFCNYNKSNWQDIKKSLNNNEMAVMMYKLNIHGVELLNAILISSSCSEPFEHVARLSNISPDEYLKTLEERYPQCDKFYLCPIGDWEDIDVAYCNEKVYMKYSLSDLANHSKELSLNNRDLYVFSNINYGECIDKKHVEPLSDGEIFCKKIKELYGDKVHIKSGNEINKRDFFEISENVGVFHISTHGFSMPVELDFNNALQLAWQLLDNDFIGDSGLALSKFNEDNNNFISGNNIKDLNYRDNMLVYLDACLTNKTSENIIGKNSLAKSFYSAGARNIIAYNINVKEDFATDFAHHFYEEIYKNPEKTYHDAFYKVKKMMKKKYEGSIYLDNDVYGRPNIGIVLWE